MLGFRQRLHWPLICACLLILPLLPCQADIDPHNARASCQSTSFDDYQVEGRMKVVDETGVAVTLTPVIATALEDAISPEIARILGFMPTCHIRVFPSSQPSSEQNALSLRNLRSDHSGTVVVDLRDESSRTVIEANEVLQQEYTQDTLQLIGQTYSIDLEWSTGAKDEDHASTLGPAIAIPVFFVIILPCCLAILCMAKLKLFLQKAENRGKAGDTWVAGDPFRQVKGDANPDDGAAWKGVEMGKLAPEASPPFPPAYPPPTSYPQATIAAQASPAPPAPYPAHSPTYPAPYSAPSPACPPPYSAPAPYTNSPYPATTPSGYPAAPAYPNPDPSAYATAYAYPTPASPGYSASPKFPPAAQQPAPYPSAYPPPPPTSQYPPV